MLTDTTADISDLTIERIAIERLLSPAGAGAAIELVSSPGTLERAMEIAPLLSGEVRVTVTGASNGSQVDRVVWSSNEDHRALAPAPAPAPQAVAPKPAAAVRRRRAAAATPAPKRTAKAPKAPAPAAKAGPPARRRTPK